MPQTSGVPSRNELTDRYEQLATDFLQRAPYAAIPRALLTSLLWYSYDHRPLGDTLAAVVSNDLAGAFRNADHVTRHVMWNLVAWLYNEAPSTCWGSPEKYRAWLEVGAAGLLIHRGAK